MNKKGSLGFITIFLLLIIAVVGYTVSQNPNFPVESFKGNFTWTHVPINITSQPELGNALEYIVNGMGNAAFEIAKWAASFAAENPNVSWKLLIYLVVFSLLAPIILSLIKIIALLVILIKDLIVSKKEKREIKKLKMKGGLNNEIKESTI